MRAVFLPVEPDVEVRRSNSQGSSRWPCGTKCRVCNSLLTQDSKKSCGSELEKLHGAGKYSGLLQVVGELRLGDSLVGVCRVIYIGYEHGEGVLRLAAEQNDK